MAGSRLVLGEAVADAQARLRDYARYVISARPVT
jgi:hypothetical protein